jgi:hypothetical protein
MTLVCTNSLETPGVSKHSVVDALLHMKCMWYMSCPAVWDAHSVVDAMPECEKGTCSRRDVDLETQQWGCGVHTALMTLCWYVSFAIHLHSINIVLRGFHRCSVTQVDGGTCVPEHSVATPTAVFLIVAHLTHCPAQK